MRHTTTVLTVLDEAEWGLTATEVGERSGVSRPDVERSLDALVRRGEAVRVDGGSEDFFRRSPDAPPSLGVPTPKE